jgi:hypothetical protein
LYRNILLQDLPSEVFRKFEAMILTPSYQP